MPTHDLSYLTLDVDDGWGVRVVYAAHGPADAGGAPGPRPSVTIVYDELREGESFEAHAEQRLLELGQRRAPLPKIERLGQSARVRIAGRDAIQTDMQLAGDRGPIAWTTAILDPGPGLGPGRRAPVVTCASRAEDAPALAATFRAILASITPTNGAPASPPPWEDDADTPPDGVPWFPMPGERHEDER
jgi:hypothetical protein